MHILLNEHSLQIAANTTITGLLQRQQLATEGLAVAINHAVIAKRRWSEHLLQHNDSVQLFQIVTGG